MAVKDYGRVITKMVDITTKKDVPRMAIAEGTIYLKPSTVIAISERRVSKGDVLTAAELSAFNAVKRTPEFLFHCHPISITGIDVNFEVKKDSISVSVQVKSTGKTGVEMEALVGVVSALLTIWDMVKAFEKDKKGQYSTTSIDNIRVVEKVKG